MDQNQCKMAAKILREAAALVEAGQIESVVATRENDFEELHTGFVKSSRPTGIQTVTIVLRGAPQAVETILPLYPKRLAVTPAKTIL
jgi:hypothetical protein